MNAAQILTEKNKFHISLGLERVKKILEILDNPQNKLQFIHVAGTNGKGSVCTIIEKILIEDGRKKIGKYTSPHLFSYAERFSVNGNYIKEEKLNQIISEINSLDSKYEIGLTEFEILTAAAFLFFCREKVDIVILETGLGGRLDATNVILNPLVTVIASISFDHTERLGDTIEKIAYEKAGIFKKGAKAVFLKENRGYKTLLSEAKVKGADIVEDNLNISVSNNIASINGRICPFALNGDFQTENLKLALLAINSMPYKIDFETVKKALKEVKWRFRMEFITFKGQNLLIDGSHNPDGARVLDEYLQKYYKDKKIKFIFGCLSNKDYKTILKTLYKKEYDFCFYEFNYQNALKYEKVREIEPRIREIKDPLSEIEKGGFDLCVVTGSLYMTGRIFKNIYTNAR